MPLEPARHRTCHTPVLPENHRVGNEHPGEPLGPVERVLWCRTCRRAVSTDDLETPGAVCLVLDEDC